MVKILVFSFFSTMYPNAPRGRQSPFIQLSNTTCHVLVFESDLGAGDGHSKALLHRKLLKQLISVFAPQCAKRPPGGRGLHRLLIFAFMCLWICSFISFLFGHRGVALSVTLTPMIYPNYVKVGDLLQNVSVYSNYFTVSERI